MEFIKQLEHEINTLLGGSFVIELEQGGIDQIVVKRGQERLSISTSVIPTLPMTEESAYRQWIRDTGGLVIFTEGLTHKRFDLPPKYQQMVSDSRARFNSEVAWVVDKIRYMLTEYDEYNRLVQIVSSLSLDELGALRNLADSRFIDIDMPLGYENAGLDAIEILREIRPELASYFTLVKYGLANLFDGRTIVATGVTMHALKLAGRA